MQEEINDLLKAAIKWQPVGSRVTCNPAPTDTDQDILVLVSEDRAMFFIDEMNAAGFDVELGEGYAEDALNAGEDNRFQSYRLQDTNLVVTIDPYFYDRFVAATSVAKRLNLLEKADRIALFQAVLYGNRCDADIGQAHEPKPPVLALPAPPPAPALPSPSDLDELLEALR